MATLIEAQQKSEPRRWTAETGEGRLDVDGVEWFACDPYPCWYRWEGDDLVTPNGRLRFADHQVADEMDDRIRNLDMAEVHEAEGTSYAELVDGEVVIVHPA